MIKAIAEISFKMDCFFPPDWLIYIYTSIDWFLYDTRLLKSIPEHECELEVPSYRLRVHIWEMKLRVAICSFKEIKLRVAS